MTPATTTRFQRLLDVMVDLLLALWIGSQWCIGYIVAPVLFKSLPTRAMAGDVAGALFLQLGWMSLLLGALIFIALLIRMGAVDWRGAELWLTLGLIGFTALALFVVHPQVAALRATLAATSTIPESFRLWHALSGAIYLICSGLGAALIGLRSWRRAD